MTGAPIQTDGNSAPSFDALESVIETPAPTPKVEAAATTIETPEVKKAPEPKVDVAAKADTFDSLEETTAKGPEAEQSPEVTEAEDEVKSEASKSIKLKVGSRGKEIDLPTDVKIPVTIDGEEKEFTLQELRNLKSGEVSYDKKFTDLDKREKAFTADKTETESQLTTILKAVIEEQDVGKALLELCRLSGQDPDPLFTAMQKATVGDVKKFMGMTEEQQSSYLLQKENEFLKGKEKSSIQRQNVEQANMELERQVSEAREALDVSDEWISKAEADFKANPKDHSWLQGKAPTKIEVIQLADALRRHDITIQALNIVDPVLAKDPKVVEFGMKELLGRKGVTVEAAAEAARVYFNRPAPVKVDPKVTDNISKKVAQVKKVSDSDDSTSAKPTREAKTDRSDFDWDAI